MDRWDVAASPDAAYEALRLPVEYPHWWPEIRDAKQLDDNRVHLVTRSLLPYDLAFTLTRRIEEPQPRILEASLDGDLVGTIRWTVEAVDGGAWISWDQRVETNKPLLDRLALIARPAFVVNHALMMRSGRRGLRAYLASLDGAPRIGP